MQSQRAHQPANRNEWPDSLSAPTCAEVERIMQEFWETLAQAPDLFQRGEVLLLHGLVNEARTLVLRMMLAANGIQYPTQTRHLNTYLGDSQRRALEKTLLMTGIFPDSSPSDSEIFKGAKSGEFAALPADSRSEPASDEKDVGENTLGGLGQNETTIGESLIAQAVALVIIYRWYAPQLTATYGCAVTDALEQTVLTRLHAGIPCWPRTITTE